MYNCMILHLIVMIICNVLHYRNNLEFTVKNNPGGSALKRRGDQDSMQGSLQQNKLPKVSNTPVSKIY